MSKRKFVIIFHSRLFMNVLTLEKARIAGSKTTAFCQVPCLGRHRVRSNQAKEAFKVKNPEELGRARSQSKLWEPECGKELGSLQLTRS